jgi:glycosyltransferase involved in cell wall biosynthesis
MISVIIPVYNSEAFLPDLIECLKRQTYKDLEILFIDDCSTDNAWSHLFDKLSDNMHYLKNDRNHGVSYCRNRGLSLAKGEYIAFIDSDDLVSDDYFETLYNLIQRKSDLDMSQISYTSEYSNLNQGERTIHFQNQKTFLHDLFQKDGNSAVWGRLFRKETIQSLRFDENLTISEDFLFLYALGRKKELRTIQSKEIKYFYRQIESSAIHRFSYQKYFPGIVMLLGLMNDGYAIKAYVLNRSFTIMRGLLRNGQLTQKEKDSLLYFRKKYFPYLLFHPSISIKNKYYFIMKAKS